MFGFNTETRVYSFRNASIPNHFTAIWKNEKFKSLKQVKSNGVLFLFRIRSGLLSYVGKIAFVRCTESVLDFVKRHL